jgi:hypothetical protein
MTQFPWERRDQTVECAPPNPAIRPAIACGE